jgi:hypothetical protein
LALHCRRLLVLLALVRLVQGLLVRALLERRVPSGV